MDNCVWHKAAAGKRKKKCSSVAGCPHNPTPEQARLFGSGSHLTCNAALPPHFGGGELPLYNASERRGILYPNSSTVTERRTQPTTCDCREICLLIFSYCVIAITTLTTESHRREQERAAACERSYVFSSFTLAAQPSD